jgi:hypothetical protein
MGAAPALAATSLPEKAAAEVGQEHVVVEGVAVADADSICSITS